MNEPNVTTTLVDVCRIGGMITSVFSGLALLVIVILIVRGLIARFRNSAAPDYSWWLLRIAFALFIFGVAGFSSDIVKTYMKLSHLRAMGAVPLLQEVVCESLIKIWFTSSVAFVAVLGTLVIGPRRKRTDDDKSGGNDSGKFKQGM